MSELFDIWQDTGINGAPRQARGEGGCELADRGIQLGPTDSRCTRG